ncbi:MAG: hypothetical protein U1F43_19255 [Myxococcota bacterium]
MQRTLRSRALPPSSAPTPTEEVGGKSKQRLKKAAKGQSFDEAEAERTPKPEPKSEPKTKAKGKVGAERNSYVLGQYGAKEREQRRLGEAHGTKVSGATHEAEHTIGFEPLNQTSGDKRKETPSARSLENKAWAYQEVKPYHRDHIGTGNQQTPDASGFTADSYRESQRALLESGDVSSAVQINQLGYAFDPRFQEERGEKATQIADDSYDTMVTNMDKVNYAQGAGTVEVGVDARQRAEMYLARRAAQTGKVPTVEEENAARARFGLPPVAEKVDEGEDEAKDDAPLAKLGDVRARLDAAIAQYPKDVYATVDPKLKEALTALMGELRELWNELSDELRNQDASVISTLDSYYLTVQHRRPSQQAMYKEQGFKAPSRG